MTIDLTEIINFLFELVATAIALYIAPRIKAWFTAKIGEANYKKLCDVAAVAVKAAEQLYSSGKGEDKLDYAIKYIERQGLEVDRTVIEAKVRELFGKDSKLFDEFLVERDDEANPEEVTHAKG